MASCRAAARVRFVSTIESLTDPSPPSAVPLGLLCEFYISGARNGSNNDVPEPPRKKRRLSEDSSCDSSVKITDDDFVTLSEVVLDLCFDEERPLDEFICAHNKLEELPVHLTQFSREENDYFDLVISTFSGKDSISVKTQVPKKELDNISLRLHHIANTASKETKPRAKSTKNIVWQDCVLLAPKEERRSFQLLARLRWTLDISTALINGFKSRKAAGELEILKNYLPDERGSGSASWSLQDFYENVHVPSKHRETSPIMDSIGLKCSLYPFQKRAVEWLMHREGVEVPGAETARSNRIPPGFITTFDSENQLCYVNHLLGYVSKGKILLENPISQLKGGILAEEMGLGKTVELIALMCLNKRIIEEKKIFDDYTASYVISSPATLIITPQAILDQWIKEIHRHAPHLRVFHYKGLPHEHSAPKLQALASVENLLKYDVVVTTYAVLSREVHYAKATPKRNLRHEKKYEPRKSPLVEISWWRVCLDEAQMIESGVSQAATVARMIPRCNAWAVSGTPLRKDIQDLRGILVFLRMEPWSSSKPLWDRIDKATFKQIFSQIALRHTKSKVRGELQLPPQKRVVITVPFTPVEEQNYVDLVKRMCEECGLTDEGAPAADDWDPEDETVISKMRTWLARLRQTCLHPQVGARNRRALGRGGPLRTVAQVLEVIIDQNENLIRTEQQDHILAQLIIGHIQSYAKDSACRNSVGRQIYQRALEEVSAFVTECRKEVKQERLRLGANSDELDFDDSGGEKDSEKVGRLPVFQKALRQALELQHACIFFVATSYFLSKSDEEATKPGSEEFQNLEKLETDYYDKAKLVRKELLQETRYKAERAMERMSQTVKGHVVTKEIDQLRDQGGIENRKVLERLDNLTEVLNKQSVQLEEWRSKVVHMLMRPLVDEDEGKEITGEEYEDSTKIQDELYVYVAALRGLAAIRHYSLTGQQLDAALIKHETKLARIQAREGKGHAPELTLETLDVQENLKPKDDERFLRSLISELRTLETNLQWQADGGNTRAATELLIIKLQLKDVQEIFNSQTKGLDILEQEMSLFHTVMNLRLNYYRQLQHISDMVAPYKEEMDETLDTTNLARMDKKERISAEKLSSLKMKRRFLHHLREESSNQDEARMCVICQCPFEIGVLTVCGHQFCKECIRMWYSEHRTCPICKRRLNLVDFHQITYKPKEVHAHEETQTQSRSSSADDQGGSRETTGSSNNAIYADISTTVMNEIRSYDLNGSFGTKIDTIARHLLWLREHNPSTKSVIFSQFSDFLDVLKGAFRYFKIGFASMENRGVETFLTDPSAEAFLLDAKADASGLNLVNATHVFLCEPLINPAIELQAIARVHRIGQHRPTAVYMYLVAGTVEEQIYEISVGRRLAHIQENNRAADEVSSPACPSRAHSSVSNHLPLTRHFTPDQETSLDAANSLELQKMPLAKLLTKGRGGGEIVPDQDLWSCLFGRPRRTSASADAGRRLLEKDGPGGREVARHLRAEAAEQRREVIVVR